MTRNAGRLKYCEIGMGLAECQARFFCETRC